MTIRKLLAMSGPGSVSLLLLLLFSNRVLAFTAGLEDAKSIARLYSAAFDREPRVQGLNFWVDSFERGQSVVEIAGELYASPEFSQKYGVLTNVEYVEQLFRNILQREGTAGGIEFWVGHLGKGVSRAKLLAEFADSQENVAKTTATFADMALVDGLWVITPPTPIAFRDVTLEAGIAYTGPSWGLSWADANDDGLPDLYTSNHGLPSNLYLNNGNGTFTESAETALPERVGDTHGAAWADFDNDGDQDLIQVVGAARGTGSDGNLVYRNEGGSFSQVAEVIGLASPLSRARHTTWLDWNNDGLLDILLSNAERVEAPSAIQLQNAGYFSAAGEETGISFTTSSLFASIAFLKEPKHPPLLIVHAVAFPEAIVPLGDTAVGDLWQDYFPSRLANVTDIVFGDIDNDGLDDALLLRGQTRSDLDQPTDRELNFRLHTTGDSKSVQFQSAGDLDLTMGPIAESWWSLDEIYIGAQGYHPDAGKFTLSTDSPAVAGRATVTGEKYARIWFDETQRYWTIEAYSAAGETLSVLVDSDSEITRVNTVGFQDFTASDKNTLFRNRSGNLVDDPDFAQVTPRSNCYSAALGDFDNDMDLDAYAVCSDPVANAPNILYINNGSGSFAVAESAGDSSGTTLGTGDSVAIADYDQDGFLDIATSNGRADRPLPAGPTKLYRNQGNTNHWLLISLIGTASNRDGIGARVELSAGGVTQYRTQDNGSHARSQNDKAIHFGLSVFSSASRVTVYWPSGAVQTLKNVAADQRLVIREPLVIRP